MNKTSHIAKLFAFTMLTAMIFTVAVSTTFAGNGKKSSESKQAKLWRQIDESSLSQPELRSVTPEKYLVFQINRTSLQNSLAKLPFEGTSAARENPLVMEIPMPDGSTQRFKMEETAVLSPELAAAFPDWKNFIGYGVDDPTLTGRFDWNAMGFHGYISTAKGTVMIDPYQKGKTENYLVFYKHEFGRSDNEFYCRVEDKMQKLIETKKSYGFAPESSSFTFGATLRTYRIAIATTGEWARNASGYTGMETPNQIRTGALAVLNTTVMRLNEIYELELSSRFQLVNPDITNDMTNIIFDDPATDPYDNTDGIPQLTINQNTITARVGTPNFDIGHLYGTGGGGVASSPSLCNDTAKAEGYSARGTNTGDPFTVDYVSHEIGHQFGADHTYNNSDPAGACTTRSATDAFEVASGATIMSYVGICTQRNLQQYVDTGFPSFHIRSLTTIDNNITTGSPSNPGCGSSAGANNIPTINAGNAFTIPALTPFTLTAVGGDADGGDVANLLYSWEEYDLAPSPSGALGTPANTYDVDTNGVLLPLFRAYSPVASNSRTFPSMTFILNPATNDPAGSNQPPLTYMGTHPTNAPGAVCEPMVTCVIGERLPTVARAMNFRVSVRDRRGGVADAGTIVTIAAGTGPFEITNQNSLNDLSPAVTWQAGMMEAVTWNVAGTTANGINTPNVNIRLSTDGGQTFPILLAGAVPNNGSAMVLVPNNPTTTARIRVEGDDNIFFDINNANFTITAPTAASVSVSGRVVTASGRGVSNAIVASTDQNGVVRTARTNSFGYYRFAEVAVGETYILSVRHKRYTFAPRAISVNEDIVGFNFVSEN